MVYTKYIDMSADGREYRSGTRYKTPYSKDGLLSEFMTFHFRLLRKSVYDEIDGFDPSFTYAPDYDLCLKVSEVAEIIHLDKNLYIYRENPDGITMSKNKEQKQFVNRAMRDAMERRGYLKNASTSTQSLSNT